MMYNSKTFPENLLNDIGAERGPIPADFESSMFYVLTLCGGERGAQMMLMRYRDGLSFDEIGHKYDMTKQRVSVIINGILEKMRYEEHRMMLQYGMTDYVQIAIERKVNSVYQTLLRDAMKKRNDAYFKSGYEKGFNDGQFGRKFNDTDMDTARKIRIDTLGLCIRSRNVFERENIATVGDVLDIGDDIAELKHFGKTCFVELVNVLRSIGINVGQYYPRTIAKFYPEVK